MSRTPEPPDLPDWAKVDAVRAVRYVIHPTDDAFKAAQRRVPAYQAARRQIVAQVQAIQASASELSETDRVAVQKAVQPLIALATKWTDRDNASRVLRPKGRPKTSADRDQRFHDIVDQLVAKGWQQPTAWNALARFVVQAFPPADDTGTLRNAHIYGTLTSGYGKSGYSKRADRSATRVAVWRSMPIADRARLAFLTRLRSARTTRRNK